jgi:hypothetical protein
VLAEVEVVLTTAHHACCCLDDEAFLELHLQFVRPMVVGVAAAVV